MVSQGFMCLSGSSDSGVGQLIGLDGQDITNTYFDSFSVSIGSYDNPGSIFVTPTSRYSSSMDDGVYTCRIPDESGERIDVNVGLYKSYPGK